MSKLGPARVEDVFQYSEDVPEKPGRHSARDGLVVFYYQARYMYEVGQFWEPMLPANASELWQQQRQRPSQVAVPA